MSCVHYLSKDEVFSFLSDSEVILRNGDLIEHNGSTYCVYSPPTLQVQSESDNARFKGLTVSVREI